MSAAGTEWGARAPGAAQAAPVDRDDDVCRRLVDRDLEDTPLELAAWLQAGGDEDADPDEWAWGDDADDPFADRDAVPVAPGVAEPAWEGASAESCTGGAAQPHPQRGRSDALARLPEAHAARDLRPSTPERRDGDDQRPPARGERESRLRDRVDDDALYRPFEESEPEPALVDAAHLRGQLSADYAADADADDLIDDFPNDLDAMQALPIAGAEPAAQARPGDRSPSATPDEATAAPGPGAAAHERWLSLLPALAVAIALALLAAGGYGVVQQRTALQAKITDLQARLAVLPSAREADALRRQQRELRTANEVLSAELRALDARNAALEQQLARLEAELGAARRDAQAGGEAPVAAGAAAAQTAAAPAGSSTPGPWFVNFGSYTRRDMAERWAQTIAGDAGDVAVESATGAGATLFRVRVNGFADRATAERVAANLETEYQLPRLWVGRRTW